MPPKDIQFQLPQVTAENIILKSIFAVNKTSLRIKSVKI